VLQCLVLLPLDASASRLKDTVNRILSDNKVKPISLESHLTRGARWVDEMVALLRASDFLIADVSRKNPNVFFELGVAEGLGKPFVLLLNAEADASDIPSDLVVTNTSPTSPTILLASPLAYAELWRLWHHVQNWQDDPRANMLRGDALPAGA